MKIKLTKICFFFLILILPLSFVAAANLSYIPRVYLAGYAGADSNLLGKADILAPIFLTANNNFFAYAQGKYAYENRTWQDNTYTGSFGLGFRQIVKDVTILGAYVFGDYTAATSGHDFWVVSPGIESLSRAWDVRVNGYFPLDKKDWIDAGWANEFGYYHHMRYEVHSQYDHWYEYYQETGIGGDTEVGRNLFKIKNILFKGYLNGYYFNIKHNDDVVGGGVRLTIEPNRSLKISLRDSYDNYEHNTFMVGVQLSFYDLFTDNKNEPINTQDLQRNLFVPIERNLATIGTGTSLPIVESDKPEDVGERLMLDNIYFFGNSPASVPNAVEDGTYEHPFSPSSFSQYKLDELYNTISPDYANIFLQGDATATAYVNATNLTLHLRQSLYGRTGNYTRPAFGDNRPLLRGLLTLEGGSTTHMQNLQSIRLQNNNGANEKGIYLNNSKNVAIDNIKIGVSTSSSLYNYIYGIYIENNSDINGGIANSTIYAVSDAGSAYGMWIDNHSNIKNIVNNELNVAGWSNTYGIYIDNNSMIGNLINNTITSTNTWKFFVFGIWIDHASTAVNLRSNTITTNSPENWSEGVGIRNKSHVGNIINNYIHAISNLANAYSIYIENSTVGDLTNNNIKAESPVSGALGVRVESWSSGDITTVDNIIGNNFTIISPGNCVGLYATAAGGGVVNIANITGNYFSATTRGIWNYGNTANIANEQDIITSNRWSPNLDTDAKKYYDGF